MKVNVLVVFGLLIAVLLSGCVQQQQNQAVDQNVNLVDNSKVIVGTDDTLKADGTQDNTGIKFEPVKLELKYKKGEALVNEIEITTNGFPQMIKDYLKTITFAENTDENFALLDVIQLVSYKMIDENKTNTCESQNLIDKKKQYQAYPNGSIVVVGSNMDISNLILPKENVTLNNGWDYAGLSYITQAVQKFKVENKEYDVLKIQFSGTVKDKVIIDGYYLFDYKNVRILKQHRS